MIISDGRERGSRCADRNNIRVGNLCCCEVEILFDCGSQLHDISIKGVAGQCGLTLTNGGKAILNKCQQISPE